MIRRQFLLFCMVGGAATVLNYGLFFALYAMGLPYLAASAAGYLAGVAAGYAANRRWTFAGSAHGHPLSYLGVYLASLALGLVVLRMLVEGAGLPPAWANLLVIGLTMCTNFLGSKHIVFRV